MSEKVIVPREPCPACEALHGEYVAGNMKITISNDDAEQRYLDLLAFCHQQTAELETALAQRDEAREEITRLERLVADWQQCGEQIMAAIGKPGQQLSDTDVIGEVERLRFELSQREKVATMARELLSMLDEPREAAWYCFQHFGSDEDDAEYAIQEWPWLKSTAEDAEGGET